MIQGNWERTSVSRRRFLGWAGLGAGGLAVAASGASPRNALAKPFFADDPFSLGVASGDPLPDGVVLWTRLAPEPLAEDGSGGLPPETYGVRYEVAEDERFSRVVRRGAVEAGPELAHSVHVEVEGLRPGREYFYRFKAGPEVSPIGRTKTAPAFGAASGMAFAFASCQENSNQRKFYTAYRNMAQEDLDLVVHLGDYIYDNPITADASPPQHVKPDPESLDQFLCRWRQVERVHRPAETDPALPGRAGALQSRRRDGRRPQQPSGRPAGRLRRPRLRDRRHRVHRNLHHLRRRYSQHELRPFDDPWFEVAHVRSPGAPITTRASFVVQDGVPGTQRA